MVLTFRSTGQEVKVVIDRQPDGRQRVGRAVQSEGNPKWWNLSIEHPSGFRQKATYCGSDMEAVVALADLLNQTKNQFEQERQRSDRPEEPYRDRNVPVDEHGNNIGNPVIKSYLK
jgi:hypothetical protein